MTGFNHQGCTAPPTLPQKLCVWADLIPSPSLTVKKRKKKKIIRPLIWIRSKI